MRSNRRFYYLGLALVAGLSLGLRFWQLGRFNSLVFDEVYYVKFAQAYLAGEPFFDAHPPMGKYAVATGIWLYEHTPWLHLTTQTVTAEVNLAPTSYRWMNALVGSLIPLVVVGLALSMTDVRETARRWSFGILAGAVVAGDGLFVTESRYGLVNIYIVFFGLLGHWLWMAARREERWAIGMVLKGLSGVALGCAIATKWNGLGYVLTLVIWECWQRTRQDVHKPCWQEILCLVFFPLATYGVLWWPHLQINSESFLSIHRILFLFHQDLDDVQVACSRWFTWPLLIKPVAYWYEEVGAQAYTVNNLGNPALWLLSAASVVLLCVQRLSRIQQKIVQLLGDQPKNEGTYNSDKSAQNDVVGYLLIGQMANWLPWVLVGRCTYNYLYMPAAVFGFMLLAWLLSGWLAISSSALSRQVGFVTLVAIAFAFVFWLPLSLGSPLTPEQLQLRWWLPTWI
ncbi:MAG: phospholipid carrier-dependent glycosyltransferase [Phormidesmis sp.]